MQRAEGSSSHAEDHQNSCSCVWGWWPVGVIRVSSIIDPWQNGLEQSHEGIQLLQLLVTNLAPIPDPFSCIRLQNVSSAAMPHISLPSSLLTSHQVTGCTRAYVLDLWLVNKVPQLLSDLWRRILQPVLQVVQVHHHLPVNARTSTTRVPLGQHRLQPPH